MFKVAEKTQLVARFPVTLPCVSARLRNR